MVKTFRCSTRRLDMVGCLPTDAHTLEHDSAHRYGHLGWSPVTLPAVQQVEGAVMRMPDGDTKAAWREQVTELQRALQMATARMLSDTSQPASRYTSASWRAICTPPPQSFHIQVASLNLLDKCAFVQLA
jgi:hypothetical protein